jgi:hypothetical protein
MTLYQRMLKENMGWIFVCRSVDSYLVFGRKRDNGADGECGNKK